MDKLKLLVSGRTLAVAVVAFALASCFYHDKHTDTDYILHTEYEVFDITKDPNVDFEKFVGFCMMPLENEEDERGKTCISLLSHRLKEKGFVEVKREELVAESGLVPTTILVGIGYNESYLYGTIQLEINAYKINKKGSGDMIWSWKAKFDGYPVCQQTIDPAFDDLFQLEPVDYGKTEPLYKKIKASTNDIERFMINLAKARRSIKAKGVDKGSEK